MSRQEELNKLAKLKQEKAQDIKSYIGRATKRLVRGDSNDEARDRYGIQKAKADLAKIESEILAHLRDLSKLRDEEADRIDKEIRERDAKVVAARKAWGEAKATEVLANHPEPDFLGVYRVSLNGCPGTYGTSLPCNTIEELVEYLRGL